MEKPAPPLGRWFCDNCGYIGTTDKAPKHTSLVCRFWAWLVDRKK